MIKPAPFRPNWTLPTVEKRLKAWVIHDPFTLVGPWRVSSTRRTFIRHCVVQSFDTREECEVWLKEARAEDFEGYDGCEIHKRKTDVRGYR